MEDLTQSNKTTRSGQGRLVFALTALTIALAVIGIASLVAYFVLRGHMQDATLTPTGSPRDWAPASAVHERLALLTLSGLPDQALIDRCLAEGRTDTALVASIYSPTLPDRARSGAFLRIAGQYASQGRDDLAIGLYRKAAMGAALSPELSDVTRIELLAQSAAGLLARQRSAEALSLLDQAAVLVEISPDLKPAQRLQLADDLGKAYADAGAAHRVPAWVLDGSRAAAPGSRGPFLADPPSSMSVSLVLEEVPSESFQNILAARKGAADQLVQFQLVRPGEEPMALIAGLKDALLAEDAIVAQLRAGDNLPAMTRAELAVVWLTTKSQIARGLFGLSLVPEWEATAGEIDAQLQTAWEALSALRGAETAGPASALTAAATTAVACEWGLIPGYDTLVGAQHLQQALTQNPPALDAWTLDIGGQDETAQYTIRAP